MNGWRFYLFLFFYDTGVQDFVPTNLTYQCRPLVPNKPVLPGPLALGVSQRDLLSWRFQIKNLHLMRYILQLVLPLSYLPGVDGDFILALIILFIKNALAYTVN